MSIRELVITMKKSIIKYLAIFVIIIIILSFTGYNLNTEPHGINTINKNQLKEYISDHNTSILKYVNLTYGNSKAEYVITYYYNSELYNTNISCLFSGSIFIYKLNQTLNFPITGISLKINDVKLTMDTYYLLNGPGKCRISNNTIERNAPPLTFLSTGNNLIHISFSVIPIYSISIYHFNGKAIHLNYNYTLRSESST